MKRDELDLRPGQSVELRGWGGAPLRGIVRLVEPSARTRISALGVEEQRLTVVIDLLDAPATLGDGYRLDASIVVWQRDKVLAVPASKAGSRPGATCASGTWVAGSRRSPTDCGQVRRSSCSHRTQFAMAPA